MRHTKASLTVFSSPLRGEGESPLPLPPPARGGGKFDEDFFRQGKGVAGAIRLSTPEAD